jgi:hypothetical protein
MNTAQEIIDAASRPAVKARFDVQDRVIRHHIARGQLPSEWFAALEDMTGQALPRHLFSFKGL